jgi:hypothetical protein
LGRKGKNTQIKSDWGSVYKNYGLKQEDFARQYQLSWGTNNRNGGLRSKVARTLND